MIQKRTLEEIEKLLEELYSQAPKKDTDRFIKLWVSEDGLREFDKIMKESIVANHDGSFSITKPPQ